ncbi:hypothetical protein H0H92_012905 [Tricholoma furcatifolium]|nr:hypothetical protein H0H92_012905 [Tricholoma furcatifolium]
MLPTLSFSLPPQDLTSLSTLALGLALPAVAYYYFSRRRAPAQNATATQNHHQAQQPSSQSSKPLKSIMQAPNPDLAPPKEDPYTTEELARYNGTNDAVGNKIYVAIKGTIFDVTKKADVYGPGKSYSVFAGKDGSRGLGMSSLKPEDAVADWSTLDEKDAKVLDDWFAFFS